MVGRMRSGVHEVAPVCCEDRIAQRDGGRVHDGVNGVHGFVARKELSAMSHAGCHAGLLTRPSARASAPMAAIDATLSSKSNTARFPLCALDSTTSELPRRRVA